MSFRGPRLIIDGEGRPSHGGPLALSARITRLFQLTGLSLDKNLDLHPIPLSFPRRREICTWSSGSPQGFWHNDFSAHRRVGLDTPVPPDVGRPNVGSPMAHQFEFSTQ
jgi:hypothetical protein